MNKTLPRFFVFAIVAACVAARAGAQLEIRGTVVDAAGQSVSDAKVELRPIVSNYELGRASLRSRTLPAAAASRSDAAGRFAIQTPQVGLWRVIVEARGFVTMHYLPLAVVEPTELAAVVLRRARTARLEVRDASGKPLTEVWVSALGADKTLWRDGAERGWSPSFRRGRTDSNGEIFLQRAAGEPLEALAFDPRTFGEGEVEVGRKESAVLTVEALPARWIEAHDEHGKPLAEVLVRSSEHGWTIGVTGPGGRLRVPARDVRLASRDGRHGVAPASGPRTVSLAEPVALEGRVLDTARHQPLAGALVWTGADPGTFARTDAAGRYRLTAPPDHRFWVQAEAAGYLPRARRINAGGAGRLPTLALVRPRTVKGAVVDASGDPVTGAALEALLERPGRRPFSRPDAADGRALSGEGGRFLLAGLQPGTRYRLRAGRKGFTTTELAFTAPEPDARTDSGLKVVLRPNRPVYGKVVDQEDRPVSGAQVVLRDAAPPRGAGPFFLSPEIAQDDPFRALTGAGGHFSLAGAPAARVDVEARKRGHAPLRVRRVEIPPGTGPADLGKLVLQPGAALAGRVVDVAGEGLEGAAVHLFKSPGSVAWPTEVRLPHREPEAVSGGEGEFILEDLLPGEPVSLYVVAAGYASTWIRNVEAPAAEPAVAVLEPALSVRGRVVDAAGEPVAGARIGLTWSATLAGSKQRWQVGTPVSRFATSERDGRFELTGLRPGDAMIELMAEGYVPPAAHELRIPAGGDAEEVLFVLEQGAVLEGRVVTRGGQPLAAVRISTERAVAVSDAEGVYRVTGIAPGLTTVTASHPSYERRRERLEIEAGVNDFDWTFEDGQPVTGRVIDETGAAVAGARTELVLDAARESRSYRGASGGDGSFRLHPVAAGRYRLRAGMEGYAVVDSADPVIVGDGPVEDLEIVLTRGATVTGRILGLDFDELARVRVEVEDDTGRSWRGRIETDYQGRYEVSHLGPGDWVIRASVDAGRRLAQARLALAPETRRVDRDLEFGDRLTLSGQVRYDGEPLPDTTVSLTGYEHSVHRTVTADYRGAFRFEDLAAGPYRLELQNSRQHLVHNERLELDGDREVVLELGTAKVSGQVVTAQRYRPLPQALVYLRHIADAPAAEEFLITIGTDDEGLFELPRVPPGRYRFGARKDGYAAAEEELEVRSGLDRAGLELALQATRGLELAVRLASGRIPGHVDVRIADVEGRVAVAESRALDAEGRTHLATVPAGTWAISVAAPGGAMATSTAIVPGEPLAVELPDAGRLHVRVPELAVSDLTATLQLLGPDQRPLRGLDVGGTLHEQWPLTAGKGTLRGVPAGVWAVRVVAPDGRAWSSLVATPGTSEVAVTLE